MKTAYVRFISHELRTPLNSVFMGMQLSIDQIPEDTQEPVELERRETLVETQSACGAALDILNELLLFDKLETGALVLNKLTVPVPELVEDSIKMFSVQTREKSLELVITNNDESMLDLSPNVGAFTPEQSLASVGSDTPASLASSLYITDEVYVDKNKVVQVIRNVVSNAIKFTPAFGKIQVNIRFAPSPSVVSIIARSSSKHKMMSYKAASDSAEHHSADGETRVRSASGKSWLSRSLDDVAPISHVHGELVIEIKDSGAGISEANQLRLFKEVVQFNPELLQNGGGSGLGMCISKGIMDMHGGSISVFSAGEGKGSVFTLRLPMMRTLASDAELPSAYHPPVASSRKRRSIRSSASHSRPRTSVTFNLRIDSVRSLDTMVESGQGLEPLNSPTPSEASGKTSFKSVFTTATEQPLQFLVVDDSSLNRKMLCRLMRNQGHECTEAVDGAQAVAMIRTTLQVHAVTDKVADAVGGVFVEADLSESCDFDMILMDFMLVACRRFIFYFLYLPLPRYPGCLTWTDPQRQRLSATWGIAAGS